MFQLDFPLHTARPASYNPRQISPESAATLRQSIATLGILKAVIVTGDKLILAGHQRTNQITALGIQTAPAMVLKSAVKPVDQARFNQLHNKCDLDFGASEMRVTLELSPGWTWLHPSDITGHVEGYASERKEMCHLLGKYGPWGNVICSPDGRILVGGLYAHCAALMRIPVLAVVIEAEKEADLQRFFGRSYGEFSYSNIKRTTWVQGMAQMYRLRGPKVRSRTYDNLVIPRLKSGQRILDFGAGQMDYVKHLRALGHDIRGVEFYFRDKNAIDVAAVHRHIDELCSDIRANGLYDVVVCDSVLNSVDSQQAEDDVLACCHAFAKPGALVVWSGRSIEDQRLRQGVSNKKRTGKGRTIEFFDADGFTALPRGDLWHFQKMHSFAQVEAHAARYFGEAEIYGNDGNRCFGRIVRPAWGAVATKTKTLDSSEILPALQREFDMPLPDGSTYGRGSDIVSAYLSALESRP